MIDFQGSIGHIHSFIWSPDSSLPIIFSAHSPSERLAILESRKISTECLPSTSPPRPRMRI